jgi:acyl-CoA synthetase (AMP-forming)/AMP-acid ligase II
MLQERYSEVNSSTIGVLWVPQFHDMCLVAGIMSCLAGNGHLYLISPLAFLKDPAIWMNVMHRVRATHTAVPNFALNLVVEKTTAEQRQQWDPSSLKLLGAGGEPNIGADARKFLDCFSASKLPPHAYAPCYGIAEHTLVVTICGVGKQFRSVRINKEAFEKEKVVEIDNEQGVEVVSNGPIPEGTDIRVLDPSTKKELAAGHIGEFWLSSPSNGLGYYNQPELSKETFDNELDGRKFLRTGDLGFIHENELYITGRLKDLIIIRGRNIYPQDAERTLLNEIPEIKRGRLSVFSIMKNASGHEEKMIVLCEPTNPKISKAEITQLTTRIHQVVSEQVSVVCSDVLVLKEGSLVKTASGKIKRAACSEMYQTGGFQKVTLSSKN